jgi:hypothetical protein
LININLGAIVRYTRRAALANISPMSTQSKLFEWHRVNAELFAAREQLDAAFRKFTMEASIEPLRRTVRELEDQSAALLREIEALRRASAEASRRVETE